MKFIPSKFCERFLTLCDLRNITPRKCIVEQFNKDVSNLSKWGNNSSIPKADVIFDMSVYFGVSSDYLLGLSDDFSCKEDGFSDEEKYLLQAFRAADPALRTAALAVLKTATPKIPEKAAKLSASQNANLRDAL